MTAWAHLPNAVHIDQVLASLKAHPDKWTAAYAAAWDTAYIESWNAAQAAAYIAARDAAYSAAYSAAQDTGYTAAWDAAWGAAWGAIAALIAWDNCAKYLTMTPDQLAVWSLLSSDPASVLLQPYVQVLAAATKQQVDNNTQTCYN